MKETKDSEIPSFEEMNKLCNGCGSCCRAIWMAFDIEYVKKVLEKNPEHDDAKFILENWEEIGIEEAKKLNPYFWCETRIKRLKERGKLNAYKCKQFDSVDNRCMVHGCKTTICSGYPFYGDHSCKPLHKKDEHRKLLFGHSYYSEDCAFKDYMETEGECRDRLSKDGITEEEVDKYIELNKK